MFVVLRIGQRTRFRLVKFIAKLISLLILLVMIGDAFMLFVFHMKFSISESLRLMAGNVTNQTLISGGVVIGVVGIVVVIFA